MAIDLDVLEKIRLFQNLDRDQLSKIQPLCDEARFSRDEAIFKVEKEAKDLYFILDGHLDVRWDFPAHETSEHMTISKVEQGGTVGWSALVEPHRYAMSVYCGSETCVLGKVTGQDLVDLFEKDNAIGYLVMSNLAFVISKRRRALQDEMYRRGAWK